MKKLIISLILLLSSFITINNVYGASGGGVHDNDLELANKWVLSNNNEDVLFNFKFTEEDLFALRDKSGFGNEYDFYLVRGYEDEDYYRIKIHFMRSIDLEKKRLVIWNNPKHDSSTNTYYYQMQIHGGGTKDTAGYYLVKEFSIKKSDNKIYSLSDYSWLLEKEGYQQGGYISFRDNYYIYTNLNQVYDEDHSVYVDVNNFFKEIIPNLKYEILNPEQNKWKVNFTFENLSNSNYYFTIVQAITGEVIKKIEYPTTSYSLDLYYDSILNVFLYDKEDNLIRSWDIDVESTYWQQNFDYYVLINRFKNKNSIIYAYMSNNPLGLDDKTCWFGEITENGQTMTEKRCDVTPVYDIVKNNILIWQIKDSNDTVIYERKMSVLGNLEETYIKLTTELLNDNSVNLKIHVENFNSQSQYIVYKIDNGEEVETRNDKVLNFTYNATVEVYVYNSDKKIVASAVKDIVADVSSLTPTPYFEDMDSLLEYFTNISDVNNELLNNFNIFWTKIKKSSLFVPLLISFVGTIIIMVVSIVKR